MVKDYPTSSFLEIIIIFNMITHLIILTKVMDICPKLRTFKLFVTACLPDLGQTLSTLGHCLDQVIDKFIMFGR